MENRVSNNQLEELLEFLVKHPALAKGIGLGARSKETVDKQWNELATKLNALGSGSSKSGERWKKYWADLKHKSKSRIAKWRQDSLATGGDLRSQDGLSEIDKKILSIIGRKAVFGDSEHRVLVFTTEPETVTVQLPDTVKSPSTGGQTCRICTSEIADSATIPANTNTQTQYMAELPQTQNVPEPSQSGKESPVIRRPTKPHRFRRSRSYTTHQSKVNPKWIMQIVKKRVEAEKRLADAAMVIAEASRMQANITSTLVDLVQRQSEDIRALLEARRLTDL